MVARCEDPVSFPAGRWSDHYGAGYLSREAQHASAKADSCVRQQFFLIPVKMQRAGAHMISR